MLVDADNKEEYMKCIFSEAYNGIPILNAYSYKNDKEFLGECLSINLNSRGVIGLEIANLFSVKDLKRTIKSNTLISFNEALNKLEKYIVSDSSSVKRLVVQSAYLIYIPSEIDGELVLSPAIRVDAEGTHFYKENGKSEAEKSKNEYIVDVIEGDVYELERIE